MDGGIEAILASRWEQQRLRAPERWGEGGTDVCDGEIEAILFRSEKIRS